MNINCIIYDGSIIPSTETILEWYDLLQDDGTLWCIVGINDIEYMKFGILMTDNKWILRNEIIIYNDTECYKVLFYTKSEKYYFKQLREPLADATITKANTSSYVVKNGKSVGGGNYSVDHSYNWKPNMDGRNKRCVWCIDNKSELINLIVTAGCPIDGKMLHIS